MNIMRLIHFVGICLLFAVIDATFLVEPDTSSTGCIGGTHNFPWTYDVTVNNAFAVVWQKDGSNILSWRLSTNKYIYGTNYSSVKVAHSNTNGAITIKSLDSSDAGIYVCIVTYDVSFDESKSNGSTLVLNSCPTVSTPEETSTTITVGQMTSSQNPSTTPYSDTTGTIIGTTADYGLTITSGRVTSEVTTPIKTDKLVGTIIAFIIPVGIFLLMIAIMTFIIIRLRRSKRIRREKNPNEPKRHKKMVTRKPNSSEDIFYVNEHNSPTLTQEFHRKKRFNKLNQEQFNSFNYPLQPYYSNLNTHYNDRREPGTAYGQSVLYRSLGYTIYQGNVPTQNGRSRSHYYH